MKDGMRVALQSQKLIVFPLFEVPILGPRMRGPVRLATFLLILKEHQTSEFAKRIWDKHVHSRPLGPPPDRSQHARPYRKLTFCCFERYII